MKKFIAGCAAVLSVAMLAGCDKKAESNALKYDDYIKTEDGKTVTISGYIQAKQSWWESDGVGMTTIYLQDDNGGYFAYELPCTKEQYDNELVKGQLIEITGVKGSWAGEVEILGEKDGVTASYKLLDGKKTYEFYDVTSLIGSDSLIDYQNQAVKFKDLVVAPQESGLAYTYKSGSNNDDIYLKLTDGENFLDVCVEYYLTGSDTDCYKAVEDLKVGDVVTLDCYLYWYNGANPHVVGVTKGANVLTKQADSLTYEQYLAAEEGTTVTIEGFVQGRQSWWDNKATIYLDDGDGAYFVYELPCTKADYDTKLAVGKKVQIKGVKGSWAGEVEVMGLSNAVEATFKSIDSKPFITYPINVTPFLGKSDLASYQNKLVTLKDMTVVKYDDENPNFKYKSGSNTDDIYIKLQNGNVTIECCVEYYLTGSDTACYKAVEGLKVGDKVTITAFLYWYNGANPQILSVTK